MNYPPRINPAKETKKIITFIADTFKKSGKTTALIAASGGVDSTTILLLTAKAIKPQNVRVLHLPSKTTDSVHLKHSQLATKAAKIPEKNITIINIGGIIQKTWNIIKQTSPIALEKKGVSGRKKRNQEIARLSRLRLANLTARIRMLVIYDQAKLHDDLVVGTENHSEHLLGYYTRFGDEASDLEPIKYLYKTQVRQLATHLKIPKEISQKPPTADLWRGQTDEGELGFSYEESDPILYLAFEQHLSPKKVSAKLTAVTKKDPKETEVLVKKVLHWAEANDFKHHLPYTL